MASGAVIVTNNGKDDFEARFDGQDYLFEAGSQTPLPLDASQHIFGYGLKGTAEKITAELISIGHRHAFHVDKSGQNLTANAILKRFKDFDIVPARLVAEEPERGSRGSRRPATEPPADED